MAEVDCNCGDAARRPSAIASGHLRTPPSRPIDSSNDQGPRVGGRGDPVRRCVCAGPDPRQPERPTHSAAHTRRRSPSPAASVHSPRLRGLPREVAPVDFPDGARRARTTRKARCARPAMATRPSTSRIRRKAKPRESVDEQDGDRGREDRRLPDVPLEQPPPGVLGRRGAREKRCHLRATATTSTNSPGPADARRRPSRPRSGPTRRTFAASAISRSATATLKPSHHPIIENKIKCSDCHNPHGALTPVMLRRRDGQPAVLFVPRRQARSLHVRAPVGGGELPVLPQPARVDLPAASERKGAEPLPGLPRRRAPPRNDLRRRSRRSNARRRRRPIPNSACFGKAPGSPNTAVNTRFIARACVNCHNAIHGSNAPGSRGQFLIR